MLHIKCFFSLKKKKLKEIYMYTSLIGKALKKCDLLVNCLSFTH